jgi:hypothetical protein
MSLLGSSFSGRTLLHGVSHGFSVSVGMRIEKVESYGNPVLLTFSTFFSRQAVLLRSYT